MFIALSTGLAVGLVTSLIAVSGLNWDLFASALVAFSAQPFFAVVLLVAVQICLSVLKWKLVLRRTAPHFDGPFSVLFFYTALGAVLANFLTVHVSTVVARSLGMRFHLNLPISTGATSTVYEQVFDALVLIVFAGTALIVWRYSPTPEIWFAWMLGTVVLFGGAMAQVAAWCSAKPIGDRKANSWPGRVARFRASVTELGLLHPKFVFQIYLLAVIRYASLMARIYIVIVGLKFSLPLTDYFVAFPITQSVNLIAITPGAFGFAEWSWAGVLTAFGVSFAAATALALQLRVINFTALAVVMALSAAHILSNWIRGRRRSGNT